MIDFETKSFIENAFIEVRHILFLIKLNRFIQEKWLVKKQIKCQLIHYSQIKMAKKTRILSELLNILTIFKILLVLICS